MILRLLLFYLLYIGIGNDLIAQSCQKSIAIKFTSVNLSTYPADPCDFWDSGTGIDPAIDIFDLNGNLLLENELDGLNGINNVQDSILFTTFDSDDCCNNGFQPELGCFEIALDTFTLYIEMYDNDGSCCDQYTFWRDDNYTFGYHTFDLNQANGTIDFGACISFNYTLVVSIKGYTEGAFKTTVCNGDTININGVEYHLSNDKGKDTLIGAAFEGCDSIVTIDVDFYNPLAFEIFGVDSICEGESLTLTTDKSFDTYRWQDGSNADTLLVSEEGSYMLTVSDQNGCTAVEEKQIAFFKTKLLELEGQATLCSGDSTNINANHIYANYLWNDGSDKEVLCVKESGIYSLTTTDFNGCTQVGTFELEVYPESNVTLSPEGSFCEGDTIRVKTTEAFDAYLWSDQSTGNSLLVKEDGRYYVTITDKNLCSADTFIDVVFFPIPEFEILSDSLICEGEQTVLSVPNNFASISWNTLDTVSNIMASDTGLYSVTITDENLCSNQDQISIGYYEEALLEITGDLQICEGDSAVIIASGMFDSFTWDDGQIGDTVLFFEEGIYTLNAVDSNGCNQMMMHELSWWELPQPQIQADSVTCVGEVFELMLAQNYVSYQWNNGSVESTLQTAEEGEYVVTVFDDNGCSNEASIALSFYDLGILDIDYPSVLCEGSTIFLKASDGFEIYEWSTGEFTQEIATFDAGTYTVTATDSNGCQLESFVEIILNTPPIVQITADRTLCPNGSVDLSLNSDFDSYLWSDGSTQNTIEVFNPGLYYITVEDENACTAVAEILIEQKSVQTPVILGADDFCFGASTLLSVMGAYQDILWSTGAITPSILIEESQTISVEVTDFDGCTSSTSLFIEELPILSVSIDSLTCLAGDVQTYYDTILVDGCLVENILNVQLAPNTFCETNVQIAVEDESCLNNNDGSLTLTIQSSYQPLRYEVLGIGQVFESGIINQELAVISVENLSAGDYQIYLYNELGYQERIDFFIGLKDPIFYTVIRDTSVLINESIVLKVMADANNFSILEWSQSGVSLCNNCLEVEVTPSQTTSYDYLLIDNNGCEYRGTVVVTTSFNTDVYIPNVFRPNSNLGNDRFLIIGPSIMDISEFKIYDRWGNLLVASAGLESSWNGLVNGKAAVSGIYVYKIDVILHNGEKAQYKGDFLLLR